MTTGARRRTRTSRPHAAALVVAVAVLLAAAACGTGGDAPALRRPPSADAVATVPAEPPRVLIFGDSLAAQHGAAAVVALRQLGVEAEVFALWGEGLFTPDQYDMGATVPDPPPSRLMHAASERVAEFRPDAVAVYVNHNYWPPYPRDAAGEPIEPGSEAFTAMARTQLTELVRRLSAGGAAIHLVSPAPERSGETAAANPIWSAYLSLQAELGFSVIDAGAAVAAPDGTRVEEVPDCRGAPARVHPPHDLHLTYHGAGLMGTVTAAALAEAVGVDPAGAGAPAEAPAAIVPFGAGYRIVTCDGAGFRFAAGGDPLRGLGLAGRGVPGDPVVGAAPARDGGAWLVTAAGVAVALDGAPPLGDVGVPAGDRVTAVAATPSGRGFWALTAGGTVLPAGDAVAAGDLAGRLAPGETAVAIAAASVPATAAAPEADADADAEAGAPAGTASAEVAGAGGGAGGPEGTPATEGTPDTSAAPDTPADGGYRVATSGGRVEGFGGASIAGDLAAAPPPGGVVALASQPGGDGYWLLDRTGRPHAFGGAPDLGSAADQPLVRLSRFASTSDFDTVAVPAAHAPTEGVALLPTGTGRGYWVLLANGAVCSFGDAHPWGGIHRAEVDEIMIYKDQPYYAEGPCRQDVGFGPPNTFPEA